MMPTLLNYLARIKYFFIDMVDTLKQDVEEIVSYEESYTSLEETHRLRHCPKNNNDIGLVYSTLYQTFKEIQNTELFKTLLSEMQYAQLPLCKNWQEQTYLPEIPNELDAPFENIIVTGVDRMSYTVWVLWFDDRTEIVKPYPNRGVYRSNCEEFETNETADIMPDGVMRAAKIRIGVVESENILKGYQWLLYEKH